MPYFPPLNLAVARAVARALVIATIALAPAARADEVSAEVMDAGRNVFLEAAEPQCAICHTLAEAGAAGEVGPNLDKLKPDADRVRLAVTKGVGVMPPYGELLTAEQIEAVTAYVAAAVGG